jgi:hypothetical protein
LCLLMNSYAKAQQIYVGFKDGLCLGALLGPIDENASGSPLIKPNFGAFGQFFVSPKIALQTELNYVHTGVQYATYIPKSDTLLPQYIPALDTTFYLASSYAADVQGMYSLKYLQIPISVLWQATEKINLQLGASLNLLTEGKNTGEVRLDLGQVAGQQDSLYTDGSPVFDSYEAYCAALFSCQQIEPFDNSKTIKKIDYSLVIGIQWWPAPSLGMFTVVNYSPPTLEKTNSTKGFHNFFINTGIAIRLTTQKQKNS